MLIANFGPEGGGSFSDEPILGIQEDIDPYFQEPVKEEGPQLDDYTREGLDISEAQFNAFGDVVKMLRVHEQIAFALASLGSYIPGPASNMLNALSLIALQAKKGTDFGVSTELPFAVSTPNGDLRTFRMTVQDVGVAPKNWFIANAVVMNEVKKGNVEPSAIAEKVKKYMQDNFYADVEQT